MSPQNRYLHVLVGERPGSRLIEVRYRVGTFGMNRTFVPATDFPRAAHLIEELAPRHDVYVGVALRTCRAGGRDAVSDGHLVFIEIDTLDAAQRIATFPLRPTMLVSSGTPGHLHAYWRLRAPTPPEQIEHANRRLAHHLSGDPACVDAARILRPPATLNHKHTPPTRVELIELNEASRYELTELTAGLPDPASPTTSRRPSPRRTIHPLDQALLSIPAARYVTALARVEPNRAGKVACPFHEDDTPSLQLYEHDHSWYCFGCRIGGSIYDFAARLWATGTKGQDFLALRTRLAAELLGTTAPAR